MDTLTGLVARADQSLSVLRTNPYLSGIVTLFLILYAGLAAPALPPQIAMLFDSSVVKVLMLSLMLILLRGQTPGLALLLAIGFVVSMHTLSTYRMFGMVHDAASAAVVVNQPITDVPYAKVEPGPISTVAWESKGDHHKVQLRGFTYEHQDIKNLLPGGHGNLDENN
jgi:hypothetical protein